MNISFKQNPRKDFRGCVKFRMSNLLAIENRIRPEKGNKGSRVELVIGFVLLSFRLSLSLLYLYLLTIIRSFIPKHVSGTERVHSMCVFHPRTHPRALLFYSKWNKSVMGETAGRRRKKDEKKNNKRKEDSHTPLYVGLHCTLPIMVVASSLSEYVHMAVCFTPFR